MIAQSFSQWINEDLLTYCKIASSKLSRLEAHFQIFRMFMKGNFDAYVLWTLDKIEQ